MSIQKIEEIAKNRDVKEFIENAPEENTNNEPKVLAKCEKCGEPTLLEFSEGRTKYIECSCQKEARIKAKIEKFKELSITSRNSGRDNFKNAILGDNKAENELYRKIKNYVKGFDKVLEINDGLLFRGGCGTGKTFLANCICNYLTEHGYTVLSFNLAGYLRTIKDNFQIESQLLEAAKEADMLFIDDLGSEKISDEWGKEKINSLIDVRYNAEKPMIITTNLSAEEMIDFLKFKGINKISDRLNEMLKEFKFTWQTKRKPKSKSFWEE